MTAVTLETLENWINEFIENIWLIFNLLSIEKNIIEWEKMAFYNYKKLLF